MGLEATDNGVSTEINISFLAPAKIGSILDIESKCLRLGKTLACTEVNIYSDNQLVATGRHSKFVALAWKKFNEQQQQ
ncbi:hypothetical protein EV182_004663 [Spiromyces aspiralis]|uniref:Uncharacterized protein n=1 Tax=Spiromyces aspiralis TaxID=68401 RepID=A0ACC1HQX0_9FUNG|nr:hypothetical protein EV182_004663 [Spiromyces aspiralis]